MVVTYDCKPALSAHGHRLLSIFSQTPITHSSPHDQLSLLGCVSAMLSYKSGPSVVQRGARRNQDVSPVNPSRHLQVYSGRDDGWLVVMHVAPLAQLCGWTRQASPTYWQSSPVHPGEQTHCTKIGHTHLCVQIFHSNANYRGFLFMKWGLAHHYLQLLDTH